MEKLFSIKEACFILDISRAAISKRIRKGQIKAIRVGTFWAIPFEELKQWQSRSCKSGTGARRLKKL
jgi:excisionase family DNA binding protein